MTKLIDLVKQTFNSNLNITLRKLLFPHNKPTLNKLNDLYLNKVFLLDWIDPVRLQIHDIIMDLFNYKIKPFNSVKSMTKKSPKVLCKIDFKNKGIETINLPRLFRSQRLRSYVNFLKIREPTVVY